MMKLHARPPQRLPLYRLSPYARPRLLSRLLSLHPLSFMCGVLAVSHAVAQAPAPAISPAETLLFETDHLARIKPPAVLAYEFRKVSNVEAGYSDRVQLDLTDSNGKTSTTLHFLSGKHKHETPALEDAHGNPVLLGFLERDIAEMKRLTGGSVAYFRKRIRMALADNAQVSVQTITYDGKSLPAQAVRIQPYLHDPMHARFEPYVNKTYIFIVSEQVPGGVYQLRSSLANGRGNTVAGAMAAKAVAPHAGASGFAATGTAQSKEMPIPATVRGPATAAGAGSTAALPAIDETLTLVSIAYPGR